MGITPEQDGEAEEYVQARKRIVESCHKHGVVPGVHSNPVVAARRIEEGFRLVRITGDHSAMARAVREDIRAVREPQG
jgi:2-keto-3-deoxy-L-rhamnonate aldolase RhmA